MEEFENYEDASDEAGTRKGKSFFLLNIFFGALVAVGSCFFALALGVNLILGLLLVGVNIVLVLLYGKYKNMEIGEKPVIAARITAFALLAAMVFSAFSVTGFEHSKEMYKVKKAVFLANFTNTYPVPFPDKLPSDCREYQFMTQGAIHGPDGISSAYLIFHTNKNEMTRLEQKCKDKKFALAEKKEPVEWDCPGGEIKYAPGEIPAHVLGRLSNDHSNDLKAPAVYKWKGRGCLFDYDTGLVVFWY